MLNRQTDTFALVGGNWVVRDFLPNLLKDTEVHYFIFNVAITNNTGAAIQALSVLDAIDIRLTKNANRRLVDCRLGDLMRIGIVKSKNNYNADQSIANAGTANIHIVLPFVDKSKENFKDTALVVNTIKTLQLEMRYNTIADVTLSNIETMVDFEKAGKSLRVNSERYIQRSSVVIAGAGQRQRWNYKPAIRTVTLIQGDYTNLSYLSVDGDKETIFDGEPDELICSARSSLNLQNYAEVTDGTGLLLTADTIPLPFVGDKASYSEQPEQQMILWFTTTGAYSCNIIEDYIIAPSSKDVSEQIKIAMPNQSINNLKSYAVDKNAKRLSGSEMAKASFIGQVKVSPITDEITATNDNTASLQVEARVSDSLNK